MKVTCIVGSARYNGSTAFLVDTFLKAMRESGAESIKYCLGELQLNYCLGCKKCYTDGKCVQSDDVEKIVRDVLTSDYVVIASPSYWGDVPGQLKTFFDRNTPYGDTNRNRVLVADKRIKGIGIAVRAGKTESENTVILDFIDHYFGHLGIEPANRISVCGTDSLSDLLHKHQNVIEEIYEYAKSIKIV